MIERMKGTRLAVLLLATLGLSALAARQYRRWIADCTRRLQAGSKVIETSRGQVEFAAFGTSGPIILFVHGQPGGYDQGRGLGEAAARHGFSMISVSRPGYLRTPLPVGRSPEEQADAFAALLDALGIERVALASLSGGGPIAIQFAIRHPARRWALVAISAVSRGKPPPATMAGRLLSTRLCTSNVAGWLIGAAVRVRPALLAELLVQDSKSRDEILSDPDKLSSFTALAQAGIQLPAQRRKGSRNDVQQLAHLAQLSLDTLRVPTLVIHGTADELVPYEHGLSLGQTVPGAELYAIEGGTHLIFVTHASQVLSRSFAFLRKHGKEMPLR